MLPSWTWPLLQSASGPQIRPSPYRLSWDSFSLCPSADFTVARPLPVDLLETSKPKLLCPRSEDDLRRPASTRTACSVPRGFSPPRRFAPRDSFGCFATRTGRGSLRCQAPRPHTIWRTRPGGPKNPFPQRGHPSKNLPRRQPPATSRWPRAFLWLPPKRCEPEDPSPLFGPLQGLAPSTFLATSVHRCRLPQMTASSHGLLYLRTLLNRSPGEPQM